MTKTYSRKTDGNKPLTANFKVSEFACKDGSDKILIDLRLVVVVQDIRDELGVTKINSGYRTPEHNKKVGGAANSNHMNGTAADIHVPGVDTVTVCKAAEKALARQKIPGAIIRYHTKNNFVHVDVRPVRLRQENNGTKAVNVEGWAEKSATPPTSANPPMPAPNIRPTLRKGSKGEHVTVLQTKLNSIQNAGLIVDGNFGAKTEEAVKVSQKAKGLIADGVVGAKTWAALGM